MRASPVLVMRKLLCQKDALMQISFLQHGIEDRICRQKEHNLQECAWEPRERLQEE